MWLSALYSHPHIKVPDEANWDCPQKGDLKLFQCIPCLYMEGESRSGLRNSGKNFFSHWNQRHLGKHVLFRDKGVFHGKWLSKCCLNSWHIELDSRKGEGPLCEKIWYQNFLEKERPIPPGTMVNQLETKAEVLSKTGFRLVSATYLAFLSKNCDLRYNAREAPWYKTCNFGVCVLSPS